MLSRRERLLEILNNLVSNGIRYNKEGGALKILLSGGDCPKLVVADTGIGIAEEDKSRIFDRFYTVDKSHNGAGAGFGLGLAIVKKLCRRAGWQLSVESELGKGTAFTILFSAQKNKRKSAGAGSRMAAPPLRFFVTKFAWRTRKNAANFLFLGAERSRAPRNARALRR